MLQTLQPVAALKKLNSGCPEQRVKIPEILTQNPGNVLKNYGIYGYMHLVIFNSWHLVKQMTDFLNFIRDIDMCQSLKFSLLFAQVFFF